MSCNFIYLFISDCCGNYFINMDFAEMKDGELISLFVYPDVPFHVVPSPNHPPHFPHFEASVHVSQCDAC